MTRTSVRILVVERAVSLRTALADVIGAMPRAMLVGTVSELNDVAGAIARFRPDVVLLSDEVGQAGIALVRRHHPEVGVILLASGSRASARLAMNALGDGVLGFISRPDSATPGDGQADLVRQLLPLLTVYLTRRAAAESASVAASYPKRAPTGPDHVLRRRGVVAPRSVGLIAIGISTGGPEALRELIAHLPGDIGVPVLLVQHMPTMFTRVLANTLDQVSELTVREARDGERPISGTVLLAPGGQHMVLRRAPAGYRVELNEDPPVHACRPSVDVLFTSIAECYTGMVLAVVMTGMGEDGRDGVRALKAKQCYCLTQSEASCVVYGMPQAVDAAELTDERVPLKYLAGRIVALVRGGGQGANG